MLTLFIGRGRDLCEGAVSKCRCDLMICEGIAGPTRIAHRKKIEDGFTDMKLNTAGRLQKGTSSIADDVCTGLDRPVCNHKVRCRAL